MSWVDNVMTWLATTGVKIGIALLIGIALWIGWGIVCKILVKGLVASTIKAREAVMRSKYKMSKTVNKGARSGTAVFSNIGQKMMHKISDKSHDDDGRQDSGKTYGDDGESKDNESNVKDDSVGSGGDTEVDMELENLKLSDAMRASMEERAHTIGGVIKGVGNFAIIIITAIMLLDAIGVSVAPLLTIAALFGIALALAAENTVEDFIGGAFILAENQYFHGETVTINGYTGTVEDVCLFCAFLFTIWCLFFYALFAIDFVTFGLLNNKAKDRKKKKKKNKHDKRLSFLIDNTAGKYSPWLICVFILILYLCVLVPPVAFNFVATINFAEDCSFFQKQKK